MLRFDKGGHPWALAWMLCMACPSLVQAQGSTVTITIGATDESVADRMRRAERAANNPLRRIQEAARLGGGPGKAAAGTAAGATTPVATSAAPATAATAAAGATAATAAAAAVTATAAAPAAAAAAPASVAAAVGSRRSAAAGTPAAPAAAGNAASAARAEPATPSAAVAAAAAPAPAAAPAALRPVPAPAGGTGAAASLVSPAAADPLTPGMAALAAMPVERTLRSDPEAAALAVQAVAAAAAEARALRPLVPAAAPVPQLLQMVEPDFAGRGPVDAEMLRFQVRFSITADGSVTDVVVQGGADRNLQRAVREAVQRWRYAPPQQPMPHTVELVVRFAG